MRLTIHKPREMTYLIEVALLESDIVKLPKSLYQYYLRAMKTGKLSTKLTILSLVAEYLEEE